MSQNEPTFYKTCRECQYANFLDFETVKCGKGVIFEVDTECGEFQDVNHSATAKEVTNLVTLAEDVDEILEAEQAYVIEKLKQEEKSEIVDFSESIQGEDDEDAEVFTPMSFEQDYRLHTHEDVSVYNHIKTRHQDIIRTVPKNQLVSFHRQVIRNGDELIQLIEPDGTKAYIRQQKKKVTICQQAVVINNPIDLLIMSHKDFDQSTEKTQLEIKHIKKQYANHIHSQVKNAKGRPIVQIKDTYKKDGSNFTTINLLKFSAHVPNIKIGRFPPNTLFYIISQKSDKHALKIKLADGTEAILFSRPDTYKSIETKLEAFVSTISKILFLVIIIGGILAILIETGYFVFIGIVIIPIAFIIMLFFSLPLYLILSQVIRRF